MNSIFGLSEKALLLSEKRSEILASNLANSSTPNYQARDIDFKAVLEQAQQASPQKIKTTNKQHLTSSQGFSGLEIGYRIPLQAAKDGNTVDSNMEVTKFMENAIRYQANLTFVKGKYQHLLTAIRGE